MYCVLNMHWTPALYTSLNQKDRAFVAACVELKIEEEKRQQMEASSKAKK